MNLFFKILFLLVLLTTNGFAAGKLVIEYVASSKQFSRPILHMVEHHRTSQTIHSRPLTLEPNNSSRALEVHRLSWTREQVRELRLKPIVAARYTPPIVETELLASLLKSSYYPLNNPKKMPIRQAPRSRFDSANHLLHSRFSSSSPFRDVQKRFYSSNSDRTDKQVEEDTSQTYAIPTYDGTFKYVLHDKQICRSFLEAFIPNETIVDLDFLDSHLRPFKEFQMARTFINDSKSKKVVKNVNDLVKVQGAKEENFSVAYMDDNNNQTIITDGGWFIRGLSDVYGDILKTYPQPERDSQVDILCRLNDAHFALVEVQVVPQDYWDRRALAYAANIYGRQLKAGDLWKDIKKVICINILGGGPKSQIWPAKTTGFTHYTFKDQNNREIDGGIEVLQYPLFHEETKRIADERGQKKGAYLEWLDFLEHAPEKKEKDVRKVLTEEVRRAYERIKSSSLPKEVAEENHQQDAELFKNSLNYLEHERQQAEAKGEAKAKVNFAKNLLSEGMDKKKVSKLTGLSPEELDKLQI